MSAAKTKRASPVPTEQIGRSIFVLRAHRVLLDEHLAALYGVQTRVLIQAVKRNRARFPEDFVFQLNTAEWAALRSQIVISKVERGGRRYARPIPSPNRAWPCSLRSSTASAPSPRFSPLSENS